MSNDRVRSLCCALLSIIITFVTQHWPETTETTPSDRNLSLRPAKLSQTVKLKIITHNPDWLTLGMVTCRARRLTSQLCCGWSALCYIISQNTKSLSRKYFSSVILATVHFNQLLLFELKTELLYLKASMVKISIHSHNLGWLVENMNIGWRPDSFTVSWQIMLYNTNCCSGEL